MKDVKPTVKSSFHAYIYLFPAFLILGVFSFYPVVRSLLMGFTTIHWRTFEVTERGLHNFQWLMGDERFALALRNTFMFVFGVVPASIAISLVIAVLLNTKIKGAAVFRSIYFLPFVTSTIAIATVWSWIYNTNHGILNYFLGFFGVDPIRWVEHPDHAMTALIIMSIWSSLGFNIVILLAGLQTVNKQLYLAAKVDGASSLKQFFSITIPMLSPSLFFVSVLGVINSFRVFAEVYALFAQGQVATPGPAGSALTVVYFIYERFFEMRQFGQASAAAVVLFVIIFIFTMIQFWVGKKFVHYN